MDEFLAQHIRRQMIKGYLQLISQSHGYTGKRFKANSVRERLVTKGESFERIKNH